MTTEAKAAQQVEFLRIMLEQGPTAVSYLKKNGELRNGVFTLNLDLIPEDKRPKNSGRALCEAEINGTLLRAYDTYHEAFRSINVDTLINMAPLTETQV